MLEVLTFVLAATAVILVLQYLADRTGLPAAALPWPGWSMAYCRGRTSPSTRT